MLQLADDTCQCVDESISFCVHLCHFLETLYDPYFTWRHFRPSSQPPLDKFTFHPALLHVEVIPFIYGKKSQCEVLNIYSYFLACYFFQYQKLSFSTIVMKF